jgi:hypothetical protein
MLIQKLAAVAAAVTLFGLTAPVSGALADTTGSVPGPMAGSPLLTFIPPAVGPLSVNIGATIIGGKVISPGVNVSTLGISLPPIQWTSPLANWHPPF